MSEKMDDVRRILEEVCDSGEDFEIRVGYSGRGMYGAKCMGIVCSSEKATCVVEEAAYLGLFGARYDSMGLHTIVYWPRPSLRPTGFES